MAKPKPRFPRVDHGRSSFAIAPWLLLLLTTAAAAQGSLDRVWRAGGVESGKLSSTSALGVTLTQGGVEKKIPAEEIVDIRLAGEPRALNLARQAAGSGRFQAALDSLAEIDDADVKRKEVAGDVAYFRALAKAKLALAGRGDLESAVQDVGQFLNAHRSNFRVPSAIALLGDLYVAQGKFDAARAQYAKLGKAQSPYYQLNSALLTGRAWQAEGRHEQALAEFDKVSASRETGPTIDPLRLAAQLEQAVSRAADGDAAGATDAIYKIIHKADPDDDQLLARAYNALGEAQLNAGDKQAALFAFLHVDLLFNRATEARAQALRRLVELWRDDGRVDRAEATAKKLAELYGDDA